jgi:hypothetical protein
MNYGYVSATRRVMCSAILLSMLLCVGLAEEKKEPNVPANPFPGITVDVKNHQVSMEAKVCLRRGILEYLVCKTQTFEHEAIFSTDVKGSHLHAALLLIGSEPNAFVGEEWSVMVKEKKATCLALSVEYEVAGALVRKRISELLVHREKKDGIVPDHWMFTGSTFYQDEGKAHYVADGSGAMIGLSPMGWPVVQFGDTLGVPYQGENLGTEARGDAIPEMGTKVRIVFSLLDDKAIAAAQAAKDIPADQKDNTSESPKP